MKYFIPSYYTISDGFQALPRGRKDAVIYLHREALNDAKEHYLLIRLFVKFFDQLHDQNIIKYVNSPSLEIDHSLKSKLKDVLTERTKNLSLTRRGDALKEMRQLNIASKAEISIKQHLGIQEEKGITATAIVCPLEIAYYKAASIDYVTYDQFSINGEIDHSLSRTAKLFRFLNTLMFFVFLCLAPIIILILAFLMETYDDQLRRTVTLVFETVPIWGIFILVFFMGLSLYWVRSRAKMLYGILECCIGVMISYRAVIVDNNYADIERLIPILVSLYVIVRGLDNIGKSVSKTRFELFWRKLFGNDY